MGTGSKAVATALMYVAVRGIFAWTPLGSPKCRGDESQMGTALSAASAKIELALNVVLVQRASIAQVWLAALGPAQTALGTLEHAVHGLV